MTSVTSRKNTLSCSRDSERITIAMIAQAGVARDVSNSQWEGY